MKALLRGFLAGFGFALGASAAGTLIGYGLGRLGEASLKRYFSPEPTPSPSPSSSPTSSTSPTPGDERPCSYCGEHHPGDPRHEDSQGCTVCGVPHSSFEPHHNGHYVVTDEEDDGGQYFKNLDAHDAESS